MIGAGEPDMKSVGGKVKDTAKGMSDDAKKFMTGDPKMDAMMQKCMEAGIPGEMHKKLAWFAGPWDAEVSVIMNGQTSVSKAKCVGEMMFDGRYVKSTFEGEMMGQPFQGLSYMGYNNASKKFESSWIDSMSTGMMILHGTLDPAGKVYSFGGEYHCPMQDKLVAQREITTIVNDSTYRMDFYMPNMEGKEEMQMSITYKRAK
jgi:hypothetical protein